MISPSNFREQLLEKFLAVHWRQWSAAGISAQVKQTESMIDIEALILSSLNIGVFDIRLLTSVLEWVDKFKEWLCISRVRQMGKVYCRFDSKLKKTILNKETIQFLENLIQKGAKEEKLSPAILSHLPAELKESANKLGERNTNVEPSLHHYALMQLYLRGIFGINARAEIFLFLFLNKKGNANEIANEIYFDQKSVLKIITRWAKTNFVSSEERGKERIFYLADGKALVKQFVPKGHYLNWCSIFYLYSIILTYLQTKPWADDSYLLSSLFRDLKNEIQILGNSLGMAVPEEKKYKGEDFSPPMADLLLKILEKL